MDKFTKDQKKRVIERKVLDAFCKLMVYARIEKSAYGMYKGDVVMSNLHSVAEVK